MGRGRAEIAQLMFAEAGVDYEDHRFEFAQWPEEKEKTLWGQVPMLYIDEKPLAQSGSINRFLAATLGFMGDTHLSAGYCDTIYETLNEVISKVPFLEKNPVKKEEGTKKVFKE